MAISAIMGMADDAARVALRLIGKNMGPPKPSETYYEPFMTGGVGKFLAKREMRVAGKGFSGAIFGRPMKGMGVALSHTKGVPYFAAIAGGIEAFTAPRGHKVGGFVKGVARTMAFTAGDVLGTTLGGPLVGMLLGSVTEKAGAAFGDAFQAFSDFNKQVRHVNMGGNYEDTRLAYTMRQRAAQEMGTSVMNARTWLGKEAALMHQ